MGIVRGRVLRADSAKVASAINCPERIVGPERRARVLREEVEAKAAAARIVAEAQARAETIKRDALQKASDTIATATRAAEEREQAKFAAAYLTLKAREEERADVDLDRALGLAVVLAERLIGATLTLDPDRVVGLAKEALAEARGTRRTRIEAHPLDAEALSLQIARIAPPENTVTVVPNADLARGSFILHTDLGILDAKLAPRLERLAAALDGALG